LVRSIALTQTANIATTSESCCNRSWRRAVFQQSMTTLRWRA